MTSESCSPTESGVRTPNATGPAPISCGSIWRSRRFSDEQSVNDALRLVYRVHQSTEHQETAHGETVAFAPRSTPSPPPSADRGISTSWRVLRTAGESALASRPPSLAETEVPQVAKKLHGLVVLAGLLGGNERVDLAHVWTSRLARNVR
jgi:hypothetical protein